MANTNQIITTVAVHENPKLGQAGVTNIDVFKVAQRNKELDEYWKVQDATNKRRRLFPVEYWQLDKLIGPGGLALIVKNINDPKKVTVKWAKYNPAKKPVLPANSMCYVISKAYYDGIITTLQLNGTSHDLGGIKRVHLTKLDSNFVVVLIGKDRNNQYTIYLQNALAKTIEIAPDGSWVTLPGGEGAGGVKLP